MIDDLIQKMGQHFIGLWQFKNYRKPREWCATYQVRGFYYDTLPKKTAEEALRTALRTLRQVKSKRKSKLKKKDCQICYG